MGAAAPSTEAALAIGPAVILVRAGVGSYALCSCLAPCLPPVRTDPYSVQPAAPLISWLLSSPLPPCCRRQVSIVFGGLFVNESNVPGPLKWLPAASLVKQAFEGACINEFKGAAQGRRLWQALAGCTQPAVMLRVLHPPPAAATLLPLRSLAHPGTFPCPSPRTAWKPFPAFLPSPPCLPGAEFELDERGGGTATGEQVLDRLSFGPPASVRKTLAAQGRCGGSWVQGLGAAQTGWLARQSPCLQAA